MWGFATPAPSATRGPAFVLARVRDGAALSWPHVSARSSVATAGEVAAPSQMEQSVDVRAATPHA
jgi:hypothetical protein